MQSHQRGLILFLKDGARKEHRPVLVVSPKNLNGGDTIRGVPFGSQQIEYRKTLPTCVHFSQGEFGLEKECHALSQFLAEFKLSEFKPGLSEGPVSEEKMLEVSKALCASLGVDFHQLCNAYPQQKLMPPR